MIPLAADANDWWHGFLILCVLVWVTRGFLLEPIVDWFRTWRVAGSGRLHAALERRRIRNFVENDRRLRAELDALRSEMYARAHPWEKENRLATIARKHRRVLCQYPTGPLPPTSGNLRGWERTSVHPRHWVNTIDDVDYVHRLDKWGVAREDWFLSAVETLRELVELRAAFERAGKEVPVELAPFTEARLAKYLDADT